MSGTNLLLKMFLINGTPHMMQAQGRCKMGWKTVSLTVFQVSLFIMFSISVNPKVTATPSPVDLPKRFKVPFISSSNMIWVPDNYTTIHEAVDAAQPGGVIYVGNGTYNEKVIISKDNLAIIGENTITTIIDGNHTGSTISIINAENVTVMGLTIQGAASYPAGGVWLKNCCNVNITGNRLVNNWFCGVRLEDSNDNWICGNEIYGNTQGIRFERSNGAIVKRNVMRDNAYGILGYFSSPIVVDNIITFNEYHGISLYYNEGNTIITYNNLSLNGNCGVWVEGKDTTLSHNILLANQGSGVGLHKAKNITISHNTIILNTACGVYLERSSNSTVANNFISDSRDGVFIDSSSHMLISYNTITDNKCGIRIDASSHNTIYNNNLVSNTQQAQCQGSTNILWDGNYPFGGNYWNNYACTDSFHGVYQDETGSDGIGDAPYTINTENQDRYPLMAFITRFDVGTWNKIVYHVSIVSNFTFSSFYFSPNETLLGFHTTGANYTFFCRVTIPNGLLWCDNIGDWRVMADHASTIPFVMESNHSTCIYFTQTYAETIQIISTHAVPEFSLIILTLLFLTLTTLSIIIVKCEKRKP